MGKTKFFRWMGYFLLLALALWIFFYDSPYFKICASDTQIIGGFIEWFGVLYGLLLAMLLIEVWTNYNRVVEEIDKEADALQMLYWTAQCLQQEDAARRIGKTIIAYVDGVLDTPGFETETQRLAAEEKIKALHRTVAQVIDWLLEALQRWGPPQVQMMIGLLEQVTHLQGWKLLLSPAAGWGLKALIVAPAALAVLSLLWELINWWLGGEDLEAIVSLAQAIVAILLLALLVGHIPTIERLGAARSYLVSLAVALFGIRVGWGLWGTLLGLALLAAGAFWRLLGTGGGVGGRPTHYRYR